MCRATVIMGVCGTGKSTVGQVLAERLDCPFLEGDSFHPPENVAKMRTGTPLDDDDRWPWLDLIGQQITIECQCHDQVIVACSALKRAYRDRLRNFAGDDTLFVLLHGGLDLLQQRLQERTHDYMPPSLLLSQLEALELPEADETALSLDVKASLSDLVQAIEAELLIRPGTPKSSCV
ncbi:MAG: gluconokinase [Pseudomonadota bacterium]